MCSCGMSKWSFPRCGVASSNFAPTVGSVRAKTTDPRERLPIGCAWQCHGIDHEIICFLLEIDPESDSVSDGQGNLPIHSALSIEDFLLLLEVHPDGIRHQNDNGQIPLHRAMGNTMSQCWITLYDQLYPDGFRTADHDGNLPIHTSCSFSKDLSTTETRMPCFNKIRLEYLLPTIAGGFLCTTWPTADPGSPTTNGSFLFVYSW
jgi:hypothetical protein